MMCLSFQHSLIFFLLPKKTYDQYIVGRVILTILVCLFAAGGFVLIVVTHWMAPIHAREVWCEKSDVTHSIYNKWNWPVFLSHFFFFCFLIHLRTPPWLLRSREVKWGSTQPLVWLWKTKTTKIKKSRCFFSGVAISNLQKSGMGN